MTNQLVGFSKHPLHGLYLIGVGDEAWLRARMHSGCTELVTRPATAADLQDDCVPERDLSGAKVRGDY